MKADSLKKSFSFQSIYQILFYFIPLVIAPYLTRVLGSSNLGVYAYINSIAGYFILFANLGISKHGQRIISTRRDDEESLRKTFWSLYIVHSVCSVITIGLYVGFIFALGGEYRDLYLIQTIYVASALFDITWLFYGLENFKSVVIKNLLIKIIECALIFIFVKSANDLWIYTLIMSGSWFLSQSVLLPGAIKYVKPIKFSKKDCIEHLKPMLVLFISVVAATLYTVFDKTLLGLLATVEDVAYYEYANKIIMVPKQLIFVIGTVMLPRACKSFEDKQFDKLRKYMDISMFATCLLGSAFVFGLMAVGQKFAVLYFGADFAKSGEAIVYMAPLVLIVMIGDVLRSEYLIPAKKDFLFTICIVISAILNIIVSVGLIPYLGVFGAVIGTTIGEIFGMVFQVICSRKMYPVKALLKNLIPFLIAGAIMFVAVYFMDRYTPATFMWLIIEVVSGVAVYALCTVLLLLFYYKEKKNDLIGKIFKKKSKEENDTHPKC